MTDDDAIVRAFVLEACELLLETNARIRSELVELREQNTRRLDDLRELNDVIQRRLDQP